jgi:hypothetical protein
MNNQFIMIMKLLAILLCIEATFILLLMVFGYVNDGRVVRLLQYALASGCVSLLILSYIRE